MHRLGFETGAEWREYSRSGKRPVDIPANPNAVYAEWAGIGDWLGTDTVPSYLRQYRSFKAARAFVHRLGLKSEHEWRKYKSAGKKPTDIPAGPDRVYAKDGWSGWGNWLGTGRRRGGWQPFKKARNFVRRLGLKSSGEWFDYCKSGRKPVDIPTIPSQTYAGTGWAGVGDWLGTGTLATSQRQYRPFKKARAFVHALGLKSSGEWLDYCRSGKKPNDIPANAYRVYAADGWSGWRDWFGTPRERVTRWRPFNKARTFARGLGLKSQDEWFDYCKSGKKPADIPTNPRGVYAEAGWDTMGDWLGTGRVAAPRRPELEARTVV